MRCASCGKSLAEDARFCASCGAQVRARSRAAEVAELGRLGELAGPSAAIGLPVIPEPAEAAASDPEIPEPAPLPGEPRPLAGVPGTEPIACAATPPAGPRPVLPPPETARREALAALSEAVAEELAEERLAAQAEGEFVQLERMTREALPPPPPPPVEPTAHLGIDQVIAARAQRLTQERAQEQAEISGTRCCVVGALVLGLVILLMLLVGLLIDRVADDAAPSSTRVAPADERWLGAAPVGGVARRAVRPSHSGVPHIQRTEDTVPSLRPADGRNGRYVLHELRQEVAGRREVLPALWAGRGGGSATG